MMASLLLFAVASKSHSSHANNGCHALLQQLLPFDAHLAVSCWMPDRKYSSSAALQPSWNSAGVIILEPTPGTLA